MVIPLKSGDISILGCDAVLLGELSPVFQRTVVQEDLDCLTLKIKVLQLFKTSELLAQ
jgi:hypothetical protein